MSKTVIIGGVAGGATAAARLRRRDESMEIVMFERGAYISYANCGLPYYIGNVIEERDALLLQSPQAMKQKFNIDVRILSEVIEIKPESQTVVVKNVETSETYEESYDDLIIATGSSPIKPSIPGIEADNIFTLWTVPDTDRIKTFLEERNPERAVVIGGGFIGLEMVENLHEAGLSVTLVERLNQVMSPLDFEMAQLIHENLRMNGVRLLLNDGVQSFESKGKVTRIHLESGEVVEADLVILSIGVRPNSELAKKAGIAVNGRGGVVVNDYLETTQPHIYAVGDVIEVNQFVTGDKTMIPLAGPANKQGRIVADNIGGDKKKYQGSLGTAVAKVFDYDVASVGLNEKNLKAQGKVKNQDYYTALINQKSHAGYYPGATPLTLKMLFTKEGTILGAQVVGQEGADKRIDTIATTMRLKGTIYDLAELELAYAPPFSSAKDPVNMLGFVAENIISGKVTFIEWDEMDELFASGRNNYTVLDITEKVEYEVFHIDGAYHIPLGQLRERMHELKKDDLIIIYCAIGVRSYNAARILMQNGFKKVVVLSGGTSFYKTMHHEIQKPDLEEYRQEVQAAMYQEDQEIKQIKVLNCSGLQCPGPIMKVNQAIAEMKDGEMVEVSATDMGFARDVEAWCRRTGNTFVKTERKDKENIVTIQKGVQSGQSFDVKSNQKENKRSSVQSSQVEIPQGKTLIVFSGDLDKVLASFIIANGAAAMGRPVTMFFTFWGLNALRKSEKVKLKKPFLDKMFGGMMPRGTRKLKLSKMHMGGMGTAMMKKVMRDKNVDSLEDLMKSAMANGVRLVACTMSMDVMGITKDELIDGVELAGVASYLGDAEESNVNLFI